jgi:hypothetical protein
LRLPLVVVAVVVVAIQVLPLAGVPQDPMDRPHPVTMPDKTVPTKPQTVVEEVVEEVAGAVAKAEPVPGVIKAGWLDHMV